MTILDNIWLNYDDNSNYGFSIISEIYDNNPNIDKNEDEFIGPVIISLWYIQRMTEYERVHAYRLLGINTLLLNEIEKRIGI